MNPAESRTPREEWEVRVVALLMGELPDDEAVAVRQQLAHDPELARFYQEMEQALPLVREAVTPALGGSSAPAEPLRMSSPRRETLLNHLKVVAMPKPAGSARRPLAWLWPMTLAASLVALLGFWGSDSGWFGGTARSSLPMAFLPSNGQAVAVESDSAVDHPAPSGPALKVPELSDSQLRAKVETVDSLALGVPAEKPPARNGRDEQDVSRRYKARSLAAARPAQPASEYGVALNAPALPTPQPEPPAVAPASPTAGAVASTALGYAAPHLGGAEADAKVTAGGALVASTETPSSPAPAPARRLPLPNPRAAVARLADEVESLQRRDEAKAAVDDGAKRRTMRYQYQLAAKSELAAPDAAGKEAVLRELVREKLEQAEPAPTLGDTPVLGKMLQASPAKQVADAGGLSNELDKAGRLTGELGELRGRGLMTNSTEAGFRGGEGFGGMAGGGGGGGRPSARFAGKKDAAPTAGEGVDHYFKEAAAESEAKLNWSFSGQADAVAPATPSFGDTLAPGSERNRVVADGKTVAGIFGNFQAQPPSPQEDVLAPRPTSGDRAEKFVERSRQDQESLRSLTTSLQRGVAAPSKAKPAAVAGNSTLFFSDFDASTLVPSGLAKNRDQAAAKPTNLAVLDGVDSHWDVRKGIQQDRLGRLDQNAAAAVAAPSSEARQIDAVEGRDLAALATPPAATPPPAPSAAPEDRAEPRRVPPPVPQPEVSTRENAFSTFSLNISDVSFKLAEASLQNGAMPDPGAIRTEEFLNTFEYRDPEPAAGRAVAFSYEEARYPFAHNRDVLRFSLKTAAKGREAGRPLNLVLLLDHSGSMERSDRIQIIQECLRVLAGQLKAQDKLSIVTFARTAQLRFDGLSGTAAVQAADQVGEFTPEGGTNLEGALDLAYQTARRHFLSGGVNRVVLLTDGAANLGDVEPEHLKHKVEEQRRQGIALDGFGIGWEGYADDVLEVLTRHGDGRYGFINTPEEAAQGFAAQLAGALQVAAADVKVQVEFNPARVTAYRQLGYAKHQLTKEQFRDNRVDAAEIGAAETGTALYLAEINPRGQGDLGVVRVRYKIPGTEEYREEEWSVPYRPGVPALDQAAPSLRLAATAGAFAEWLAASPFAGEVTPDALLRLLQGVPAQYGADTRPPRLERMIRQAKSISGK